jgi:DNA-binding NarL/FixJ family response regulator
MLVDDHYIVRAGLKEIFKETGDIVVDAEAATGTEALELFRARHFDAVLLDISLPDRSGLDVLRRMHGERENLPVLIVSTHSEEQYAMPVLKAGANGYITKTSSSAEILKATRIVLNGDKYVSPSLEQQLAMAYVTDADPLPHEKLSTREFEVFKKLAEGRSVSQIANEFFVSVKTISTHRGHIMVKMGLRNNGDLTLYAIKNDLIA